MTGSNVWVLESSPSYPFERVCMQVILCIVKLSQGKRLRCSLYAQRT